VAALLAMVVDQLLALIEAGTVKRSRWRVMLGASLLVLGCAAAVAPRLSADEPDYVVGAKSFSEQYILSSLLADRIRAQGGTAIRKTGLGSAIAFRALSRNEIDAYVDYSGTLWANVMQRTDRPSREIVLRTTAQWLHEHHGVELLGPLGFENAYALAMRRQQAAELGIRSIRDLAAHAPNLKIGGDFEFFARPEWTALRDHYGLRFAERRQFQSTFMYKAVSSGEVDVISAFSSDGRIAAEDLVVLDDPDQVLLPYDAVILLSPRRAHDAVLRAALEPLRNQVNIELMREANMMVDRESDKVTPAAAARWLAERIDAGSR
jgi:osmoprotectant transport system permease protein